MIVVRNVRILDNSESFQLFPIEITYVEDGKENVRLTSATEVIKLFKAAQKIAHADGALCSVCDFEQNTDQVCEEHGIYKIVPRKKYIICEKCEIHHFENCGSCFGFGVYSVPERPGEVFPVTADEAIETKEFRGEVKACPECGSTTLGIPIN